MTADFAFLTTPKSNIFLRIFNHFIDVKLSFKRRLQLFETRSTGFECVFKCFYKKLLSFWTQLQLFLKKTMEQCLPLFVSFRPFLIPTLIIVSISTIQMKKHRYVFGVRRMVGVDKTSELQLQIKESFYSLPPTHVTNVTTNQRVSIARHFSLNSEELPVCHKTPAFIVLNILNRYVQYQCHFCTTFSFVLPTSTDRLIDTYMSLMLLSSMQVGSRYHQLFALLLQVQQMLEE